VLVKRSKLSGRRRVNNDLWGMQYVSGYKFGCGQHWCLPCLRNRRSMRIHEWGIENVELSHRCGSFRPVLECGAASRGKHCQGPEAHLPAFDTRLRRNHPTDILLSTCRPLRATRWICRSVHFRLIYIEIWVGTLTNIAKATHHYRQIGHHMSDKTQPARLIDRGSRADIVTYSPVSGKEHA